MDYFKNKKIEDYSKNLQDVFNVLTITGKYQIIGSASLNSIRYNSDYDLQEFINDKSNKNVLDKIYNYFKKKFIYCKKNKNYFITDFKCGIGLDGEPLRWDYKKIIEGINDGITFQNALLQKSTIKMDMIVLIDGIFTEFSENYYFKIGKDTNYYNENIELGIKKSLNEYLYMKNYWKVLKRLFSLLLREKKKNKTKLIKLIDFFNSNVGLINKCKNEFDILLIVIDQKFRKPKLDDILYNIEKIKEWSQEAGIELMYDKFFKMTSLKKIEKLIIKTRDELADIVNNYSYNYLKDNFKNKI